MAQTAAELAGPCLEKICEIASGRKYTKLRLEAKVSLPPADTWLQAEPLRYVFCDLMADHWRIHPCGCLYLNSPESHPEKWVSRDTLCSCMLTEAPMIPC